MIVANGCPKSGTHALMALLTSMGLIRTPGILDGLRNRMVLRSTKSDPNVPPIRDAFNYEDCCFVHGHVPARFAPHLAKCKVITMLRDPRDVLTSCMRHDQMSTSFKSLEFLMRNYTGRPFVEVYRSFLGWRGIGLVIRYEDFPRSFVRADVYSGAQRDRNTLNDEPSRWQDWWGERSQALWEQEGGLQLEEEAGYVKS